MLEKFNLRPATSFCLNNIKAVSPFLLPPFSYFKLEPLEFKAADSFFESGRMPTLTKSQKTINLGSGNPVSTQWSLPSCFFYFGTKVNVQGVDGLLGCDCWALTGIPEPKMVVFCNWEGLALFHFQKNYLLKAFLEKSKKINGKAFQKVLLEYNTSTVLGKTGKTLALP